MIDIKTLSCCDKYASCHDSSAASVVNKRQKEAPAAYRTKAKELDRLLIAKQVVAVSPLGTPGPYESVLNGFGKVLANFLFWDAQKVDFFFLLPPRAGVVGF